MDKALGNIIYSDNTTVQFPYKCNGIQILEISEADKCIYIRARSEYPRLDLYLNGALCVRQQSRGEFIFCEPVSCGVLEIKLIGDNVSRRVWILLSK